MITIKFHTKDFIKIVYWPAVPDKDERVDIDGEAYRVTYRVWYINDNDTQEVESYVEVGLVKYFA